MKFVVYTVCIFCVCCILSCNRSLSHPKQQKQKQFLYKAELDTSKNNYGVHIEVKQVLPDTKEFIPMSIDDRDIIGRSKYTQDEQVKILGEYLTFRNDTSTSNKEYRFKAAYYMTHPESIEGFTVQIEALCSFTRMLTEGLPPIKPALINRTTGEQLNINPKVVSEVHDIYVKWYSENKKTDFKNISLPLAGSPYCWLGEVKAWSHF